MVFKVVISISILTIFLVISTCTVNQISWSNAESRPIKCDLISKNYKGSTLESHAIPTITSGGSVGVGVVTTGDSEQYISAFDCEGLGSVVTDDKSIFTKAKKHNTLLIKTRDNDYRVKGIL